LTMKPETKRLNTGQGVKLFKLGRIILHVLKEALQ
jgi:hypothetical protein